MAITAENLTARAREHLSEQSEDVRFAPERLHALIPSAVQLWLARNKQDARKMRGLLSETGEITITNGVADCADALDAKGIRVELISDDDVVVSGSTYSVAFVNSRARLARGGIQDRFYLAAYFDGKKMYFRDPAAADTDSALTNLNGTLTIRGISAGVALDDISAAFEGELATVLAEVARSFNSDGESKSSAVHYQKAMRKL